MLGRRWRKACFACVAGASVIAAAACGSSSKAPPNTAPPNAATSSTSAPGAKSSAYAVGELTDTFVDPHRATVADGDVPARPNRTLVTKIFYPVAGAPTGQVAPGAPADRKDGPYPLIVFAHGFGSGGGEYEGLLERWVAAGFVVAAPLFPLTHDNTPGGLDAADYANQPGDMSFVITSVLHASASADGPLSGLVDPHEVGAAGHSLGGVTTLGLAANTCCQDARVEGAIVFSGDSEGFAGGHFDYAKAPPILFVHGDHDAVVPYESGVDAFNLARGPKGLVTVIGGGHGSTVDPATRAFPSIVRATTDFFDAYLKGDTAAASNIAGAAVNGATRIVFDPAPGSVVTVPTTAPPQLPVHHASASRTSGLANGTAVTVQWTNFTPGKSVNVVECSKRASLDASICDLKHATLLQPDPTGSGSATIGIVTGAVGAGTCDATHDTCAIIVNDGGSLAPAASVTIPISFAG